MKGDGAELRGGVWRAGHLLLLRQDARANPLRLGEVILAHRLRGAILWVDPASSQRIPGWMRGREESREGAGVTVPL